MVNVNLYRRLSLSILHMLRYADVYG